MSISAQNILPYLKVDRDWWRGAVIYQIYPRSFQDSNGDGIGDLQGIIQRLPYIARLGVDAIWISPFFTSPMLDYGYDVSDYRDISPMFGTLDDFDEMMRVAHGLGIRVMIDLVLSHTSDQHPWFEESRADRTNPKHDWYVWSDPKPDGTPPNNWLSIFGGSAWEWDAERLQYFMHNFLKEQPDLNFHNREVQDALLDVTRFWLDRGVDGFRLDTINFYFCDAELRDNPALPVERRNTSIAPAVNPYNHQEHLFDKNRPENIDFLRRLRAVMEEYPAIAAVGEVGDAQFGTQIMSAYTAGNDLMHMCYAFDFLSGDSIEADRVVSVLDHFNEVSADSWSCWAASNHDVERHASRWDLSVDAQKLVSSLLMSLRGSVCLYQGEELGFGEAEVEFKHLQDPYGKKFWPNFKGRDGCRTPIAWTPEVPNGGFSAAEPWLPVSGDHLAQSASSQENNPASLLSHYRRMIDFRKRTPALSKGQLDKLESSGEIVSFEREFEGDTLFCVFNLSDTDGSVELPAGNWAPITELDFKHEINNGRIELPAWQAFFARKKEQGE